jgi:segregation and condensation protein B
LALRKLAQLANLTDATEARTLLAGLRKCYDERGCAFQVAQVGGGYQLLSRPEFAAWLTPLAGRGQEIRLSPPALETLAVVAYRQPILRAEVEAIRGVACGEILRQLLDRDLLRIVGRSEELGRPLWYGTTKQFLQMFGLCNLDELPWADQLRRPASQSDERLPNNSAVRGAGLTGDVEAA